MCKIHILISMSRSCGGCGRLLLSRKGGSDGEGVMERENEREGVVEREREREGERGREREREEERGRERGEGERGREG